MVHNHFMTQPSQTDPQFKLRLPAALKTRIQASAGKNNRSMNAEILATLEHKYPRPTGSSRIRLLARFLSMDPDSRSMLLSELLNQFEKEGTEKLKDNAGLIEVLAILSNVDDHTEEGQAQHREIDETLDRVLEALAETAPTTTEGGT